MFFINIVVLVIVATIVPSCFYYIIKYKTVLLEGADHTSSLSLFGIGSNHYWKHIPST